MQQPTVKSPQNKPAAAVAPKVSAAAVAALQGRVAEMVGSGTLDSAPFSYHH